MKDLVLHMDLHISGLCSSVYMEWVACVKTWVRINWINIIRSFLMIAAVEGIIRVCV